MKSNYLLIDRVRAPQAVVTQQVHMLEGESHVSRGPIILLGNIMIVLRLRNKLNDLKVSRDSQVKYKLLFFYSRTFVLCVAVMVP